MSFLAKDRLIFDAADLPTSDQVASFLYAPDGTALTVTGSSLNVNVSNTVTVSATDLDIRNLVNTQDSIAIGDEVDIVDMQLIGAAFDAAPQAFPIAAVRQDAGGNFAGVADGDAGPLMLNDMGELRVAAALSSSVADDAVDAENPIKVGGRAVSGALTALSATGDRYHLLADLYRRTWVNTAPNITCANAAQTIGLTEVELGTGLAGRRKLAITNLGSKDIFVGATGVTTSNGVRVARGASWSEDVGPDINIFAISGTAGQDVRVLEIA